MRYENNHIVTDYTKRAKTVQSLKVINKIANEKGIEEANRIADLIIKNTYRTLMTRGMKGCYVYCTDKNYMFLIIIVLTFILIDIKMVV